MSEEAPLDEVLRTFMTSNNHMLIAHSGGAASHDGALIADTVVTGLITLEDVMETLIQVRPLQLRCSSRTQMIKFGGFWSTLSTGP